MEEGRENNKDYYSGVKIYNDGSHYIGIPHTENPKRKRYRLKPQEEVITVTESKDDEKSVITYENGTDDQTVGQTERTPTVNYSMLYIGNSAVCDTKNARQKYPKRWNSIFHHRKNFRILWKEISNVKKKRDRAKQTYGA